MSRLIIARHGNTFSPGEIVTRVGGRTDLPLSPSGRAQARALGRHFAAAGERFARAYCSPLRRTRETAEAILAETGDALTPQPLEFLREIDYGPDENRPEAEVVARIGRDALARWDEDGVPPPGWSADPAALVAGWRALFATLASSFGLTLLVTSNGVARFALVAADQRARCMRGRLRTGAYGEIELTADACARVAFWDERPEACGAGKG